jgi:hypothetical protein
MEPKRNGEGAGTPFKRCNLCGKEWHSRDEFLNDRAVVLNGYQWNVQNVHLSVGSGGLLLFTHQAEQCGTTMALSASLFKAIRRKADRGARKQSPASSPVGNNQPVPVPAI